MSYTRHSNISLIGHHCLPGCSLTNCDHRTDNLQSSVNLSCTVVNVSSFEWQWLFKKNKLDLPGRSQILTNNTTRTSILTINQVRYTDTGNYSCIVRHLHGTVNYIRLIKLELTGTNY